MSSYTLRECRLCGSDKLEPILDLGETPPGDSYEVNQAKAKALEKFPLGCSLCLNCGHVQLSFFVDPRLIYVNYIYLTQDSLGLANHFNTYFNQVMNYLKPVDELKVLEIGCNDGTLLSQFKSNGARCLGIDPSIAAVAVANSRGLTVIEGYFGQVTKWQALEILGAPDIIIANNVLANVEFLPEFLGLIAEMMNEKSVFIFETGYLKYLSEMRVIDNIHHEHIDYFAITPLKQFFEKAGMKIVNVVESGSKGSSIRVFVTKANSQLEADESVNSLVKNEKEKKYFEAKTYEELSRALVVESERLKKSIAKYRQAGRKIVGYGASVGTTTLLESLFLGEELDFLVDDNLRRVGTFSPGNGLPVRAPATLASGDYFVIVFAWRYAFAIVPKILQTFGEVPVTTIWGEGE